MLITYKGKTQSAHKWACELGLGRGTVSSRLSRGWTIEQTLETPPDKVFASRSDERIASKSDAEIMLNELPIDQWPASLRALLDANPKRKPGMWLRTNHRKEFDEWFTHTYRA